MAFGRVRNNKRSSSYSNSYASSITTVVFIALCVLGVWMLTSDSTVVSPKATTRASTTVTRDESNELTKPDDSTTLNKPNEKLNSDTFEDNPGELPDDALKNGDPQKSPEEQKKSDQESSKDFSTESNVGGSYQHNVEKPDPNSVQTNEPKVDDTGNKVKENEPQVDENAHGLGGNESVEEHEKQNERQIQVSEESTLTEKQNIQQSAATDQESSRPKQQDQVEESRERDQRKSTASGQSSEEATQKNDNQQQALEDRQQEQGQEQGQEQEQEQEKKASNQHTGGEQQKDINQQQTAEEQQQQQGEKPITYSDETKKDPSKQESSEDLNTDQQDKPKLQQQEDEAAKQADFPNSGIPKESNESKRSWSTQAAHSNDEKERRKVNVKGKDDESLYGYTWQLCNVTAGYDYIPCLDNEKALKTLRTTKYFQHRERHCPEDPPTCLVPVPQGYKKQCPLHPKMNTRLRSSLPLREVYLQYQL